MPVIPKPEGFKPFGGRTVVMFGGINIEAMRKWQARVRDAEKPAAPDESVDHGSHAPGGASQRDKAAD